MNLLSYLGNGLGQIGRGIQNLPNTLGAAAFPVDPNAAATMDPVLIEQQRRMALARLGLGLSGASAQGAPFGQAALYGLGQGAEPFDHFVATAYTNTMRKQEGDKQDARYKAERDYQMQQDQQTQSRWETQQANEFKRQQLALDAQRAWHEATIKVEREKLAGAKSRNGLTEPPSGYRYRPDGSLEFVPGGPADPTAVGKGGKLAQQEQQSLSYVTRMTGAEQTLQKLSYRPTTYAQSSAAIPLIGNMLTPEKYQDYQQAAREWISGLLRFDSGAAVPETEFKRYFYTYFPQVGDGPGVIAQKTQARERARQSIERGLSPVANSRIGLGGQPSMPVNGGLGQVPQQFSSDVAARAQRYLQ